MGRYVIRLLIAASVGLGTGFVTYVLVFAVFDWETVAYFAGVVVGLVVGGACVAEPLDESATPGVLLCALTVVPSCVAVLALNYESIPLLSDIHLAGQWGYIAVFAGSAGLRPRSPDTAEPLCGPHSASP